MFCSFFAAATGVESQSFSLLHYSRASLVLVPLVLTRVRTSEGRLGYSSPRFPKLFGLPFAILVFPLCNLSLAAGCSRSSFLSSALAARGGRRKFRTGASSPAPVCALPGAACGLGAAHSQGLVVGPAPKYKWRGSVSLRYIRGSTGLCFRPPPWLPSGGRQNAGRNAVFCRVMYREPPYLGSAQGSTVS